MRASGFGPRKVFLFCLGALTGYLLTLPHVLQRVVRTSAQGFLPPLLAFSTVEVHVSPSTWRVSQNLQMVCFMAGLCRICDLRETARRLEAIWRDIFCVALRSLAVGAGALCSGPEDEGFDEAS